MSVVRPVIVLLTAVVLVSGCASTPADRIVDSVTVDPSPPAASSTPPAPGASQDPTGQDHADLTVTVDDGRGTVTTWHLTCAPDGGDHPSPAAACRVLAEHGATALPAVPADRMCTQVFGGPQTARITGTWRGAAVDARLSRTDGCQIARWNALVGLLPAPAS